MKAGPHEIIDHELVRVAAAAVKTKSIFLRNPNALNEEIRLDDAFGTHDIQRDVAPRAVALRLVPA